MFFVCFYLVFPIVFGYESTTQPSSSENTNVLEISGNLTEALNNITIPTHNVSIITQRITQPVQSIKVERNLETIPSPNNTKKELKKSGSLNEFRPSPQLDSFYEFNKFPVAQVLPEAKTIGNFNPGHNWPEKSSIPSWSNDIRGAQNSWYESSKSHQTSWNQQFNSDVTTEQPWTSRVKFPVTEIKDTPYKFVGSNEKLNPYLPPTNFPTTTEGFSFNKPVEVPNRNVKPNKPSSGFWQKLMGTDSNVNKNGVAAQKTFFDYNLMEKPPNYGTSIKEYDTGISSYSSSKDNPWSKIIKLLTAVIPIGLFISALTPTVISVTSVNDTQSRYRAVDNSHLQEITHRLPTTLKYAEQLRSCEDKILCELLVTASVSKNSAEHIRNLLDTFTEHEDLNSKKHDLLKVFEAVKKEDCSPVVCKTLKNPN